MVSVQEVLSDVVALDYPFTPWNMLVLSDSKDAYTDAEWVPQVRNRQTPKSTNPGVVRRLIVVCVAVCSSCRGCWRGWSPTAPRSW